MKEQFSIIKNKTYKLAAIGILGALCIAFSCLSIKTGPLTISFASLPIYVAVFYFGAPEAILVALLGGAADQIIFYGISTTMPLWLIPGILRAVTAYLLSYWYNKCYKKPIETSYIVTLSVCVISNLICTFATTAVMAIDALLFDYFSWTYILSSLGMRLFSSTIMAILCGIVISPIVNILKQKRRFDE